MPVVLTSLADPLPESLAALFRGADGRSLYTDIAWFRLLARETGLNPEHCIVAALQDDTNQATAAIALDRRQRPHHQPPTREIGSLANYYSGVFAPVLAPGIGADAVRALVCGTARALGGVDLFDLLPLPDDPPLLLAIEAGFEDAGFATARYEAFGNWYEAVSGSYDAYLARRPTELRNLLVRKRRQAIRQGIRFEIIAQSDGVERAIEAYEAVYRASWKRAEPHKSFMPQLMRLAASRGILRVGLCHLEERPIGAQVWLVEHRHATIYKLAHDENLQRLSIGSLVTAEMMRHVIEQDRVEEVDLGCGDDPYKRLWLSQRRPRWGILASSNHTWRGLMARLRHVTLPRLIRRMRARAQETEGGRADRSPS